MMIKPVVNFEKGEKLKYYKEIPCLDAQINE